MREHSFSIIASSGNISTIKNVLTIFLEILSSKIMVEKINVILINLESKNTINQNLNIEDIYNLIKIKFDICPENFCPEIRYVNLKKNNISKNIVYLFNSLLKNEIKENIYVDITTGQKEISAILYACASIARIDNILYVDVSKNNNGKFYELWEEKSIKEKYSIDYVNHKLDIKSLSESSHFDEIISNYEHSLTI